MSFAKQRGIDICGRRVTCGAQHALILTPTRDGLIRRPLSSWPPLYMNCELNNAEIWLTSACNDDSNKDPKEVKEVRSSFVFLFYFNPVFYADLSFVAIVWTICR